MSCFCRGGPNCCMNTNFNYVAPYYYQEPGRLPKTFSWVPAQSSPIKGKKRKNIKSHMEVVQR